MNGADQWNSTSGIQGDAAMNGADQWNSTSGIQGDTAMNGADQWNSTSGIQGDTAMNGADQWNSTSGIQGDTPMNGADQWNSTSGHSCLALAIATGALGISSQAINVNEMRNALLRTAHISRDIAPAYELTQQHTVFLAFFSIIFFCFKIL